ncbi:MAG TPA: hypothetical protein VH590_18965 [Ktedonobacterales bacterium]|jgi:hypothetical protein
MMLFDPYAYDLARSARPAAPSSGAGAALIEAALLAVPQEARQMLWRGLREAASGALDVWERTPGHSGAPPVLAVQHAGKPQFQASMLRAQTLANWHRLMGLELRLAVEALERLTVAVAANVARAWARLAEQCARVGQLYSELARRAGEVTAQAIVRWELRLLRYRSSPVLAPLIYN